MDRQRNTVSAGGNISGIVMAGNNNSVTAPPTPPAGEPAATRAEGMTPRLGFVVDIVGFGSRDAEGRRDLADRLDLLVRAVVADLGVDFDEAEHDDSGDARLMFLPVGVDWSRVLPSLVSGVITRLGRDNRKYRDRMRVRMAVGAGLLGAGAEPLGFGGELVIDLHRLVDSEVLRQAVRDHPDADLALLVSQVLHDEVIRPGHLDPADFVRTEVRMKEFTAFAWLRLC